MGDSEDKARLISLGAERLADALLKLARRSDEALEEVRRLLSSSEENLQRFRKRLEWLKRGRKFYDWRGAYELATELEEMLEDLRAAAPEPRQGLELLAAFYACDRRTLERCDDSDGVVGHIFSATAAELFREFAQRCGDKPWVADLVFRLCLDDDYGVRRGLLYGIADYLPEGEIRALANRFLDAARVDPERAFHLRHGAEILAKALNDPRLFERAALCGRDPVPPGIPLEIAEAYLEAGEPEGALEWLARAPSPWNAERHDHLLYRAYEALGERGKMAQVAWRIFRRQPSREHLEMLLRAIGEDRRDEVVHQEVERILNEKEFSHEAASFLVEIGRLAEAEEYLLRHREKLDGGRYQALLPWAKALEEGGYPLGATVVYRALLESILERANTKYYRHGVRYLRKLEALAERIADWRGLTPHGEYFRGIREAHKRKHSFWGRYEGKR